MKRLLSVLGALVLVGAVVAAVVWQRPDPTPPPAPLKDFVLQSATRQELWSSRNGDPKSPIVQQVLAELRLQGSFQFDDLRRAGATVVTTIDPGAQAAGVAAVEMTAPAQPGTLRYSVTAVDPATGGVLAYVPGAQGEDSTDYAGGVLKQPGSAFFPIDVVAGLQNGQTLDSTYDGRSPRAYGTGSAKIVIRNKKNAMCSQHCTVREALAKSYNTVMHDMVYNQVGIRPTVAAARQAGVPEVVVLNGVEKKLLVGEGGGIPNAGFSLGTDMAAMRPLDLTTVYATFAAGGVWHRTHFVTQVVGENGNPLYQATESTSSAFNPDRAQSKAISDQVTTVLKDSTQCPGAVCRADEYEMDPELTGWAGQNSHAWTIGYTDRMAITVMVTNADATKPAKDANAAPVTGDGLPKTIWQRFVERA